MSHLPHTFLSPVTFVREDLFAFTNQSLHCNNCYFSCLEEPLLSWTAQPMQCQVLCKKTSMYDFVLGQLSSAPYALLISDIYT